MSALEARLAQFYDWTQQFITGDEKGEAQIFLDRLFQALGHSGSVDAGGTYEHRTRRKGTATSFADYVWKPRVLIEMKRRGAKLEEHYRQAFDYWVRLVPNRPRYVVLCNFDEFWVYDFETQLDEPKEKLPLSELTKRWGALSFLFPEPAEPVFNNDQEAVTREAADLLATCFRSMVARGVEHGLAQRFALQCLVALFAEDIELLERYFFARLLDECTSPQLSYDLIGNLFRAMNDRGVTAGGRYKGVGYFNGGLFAHPAAIELTRDEVDLLKNAAMKNWSKVRPEIFGTIFEHSLGKEERHAYGAHFTSGADIMKIVLPTIVEPWTLAIEAATSQRDLHGLLERLQQLRVLDPACGSGNFLYIAYREIKRLEARIIERLQELSGKDRQEQRRFGFVTARNFYGLDVNPFAIELAKVTMSIARKLAIDELHGTEEPLPLDNLDQNFRVADALLMDDGARTPWPECDVIIGNPPFLGSKKLKPERGPDYVNALRRAYPEVPGMADYCVYWIRRARDHLPLPTAADPFAGRAGLVGTQNIRNNQSRVGGLGHVVTDGTIIEAVDNQPWSGEADVHVSIVNWMRTQDKALLPAIRRLWFVVPEARRTRRRRGAGPASKRYELDVREVAHLNADLSDGVDVTGAKVLVANAEPKRAFQGITPGHDGFVLSTQEAQYLLARETRAVEVVHPYLIGRELVTGDGSPERFVVDFQQRGLPEARGFGAVFEQIEKTVLPTRLAKLEKGKDDAGNVRPHHEQFLSRWWQLSWGRADMQAAVARLKGRYIACSRVTKRPIFVFVDADIRPADALQTFALDDDYSFGVLQSQLHWVWFTTKCSKLNARFTYTADTVFDTFPWPQSASAAQIDAVALAGREIRRLRDQALGHVSGGLREVYRLLELPGRDALKDAHAALDAAVRAAYAFKPKEDALSVLMALNTALALRESQGDAIQGPGIPTNYINPEALLSDDRIRAR